MDRESAPVPLELRKITFSEDEVLSATVNYCLRANIDLPDARTEGITFDNDTSRIVTLNFDTFDPHEVAQVQLSAKQMIAAMILYCHKHRIPLPRHGKKALKVERDGLTVMVRFDRDQRRRRAA
jgi:hypothetical protein